MSRQGRRDSREDIIHTHKMDSNRASMELEEFEFDDPGNQSQTDGQKTLTMKDKDEMLQELKKENFDLKLRLYMTQKNSEDAEGKVGEYEQQLAALLNSLEEQQRLSEQQTRELEEARLREKQLLNEQKKLETQCKEQDETIHNLSLNLSKASKSMLDISTSRPGRSSTPIRHAKSAYFPDDNAASASDSEDHESGVRPFSNQTNISHVTPMPRDPSTINANERANLVDNDRGVHHSYSEGTKYMVDNPDTKNYHYHNNTNNYDMNRTEGHENVGVVRPNNTRTVVDVEFPEPIEEKQIQKKKKKGIMKVFKLCTGKSGQAAERSKDDMYVKREPPRVTMTTYTNETIN